MLRRPHRFFQKLFKKSKKSTTLSSLKGRSLRHVTRHSRRRQRALIYSHLRLKINLKRLNCRQNHKTTDCTWNKVKQSGLSSSQAALTQNHRLLASSHWKNESDQRSSHDGVPNIFLSPNNLQILQSKTSHPSFTTPATHNQESRTLLPSFEKKKKDNKKNPPKAFVPMHQIHQQCAERVSQ